MLLRYILSSLVLISLIVLVSCTSSEAESVTIEERDGVIYVENHGEGLWSGEVPVHFELEQVYGADTEPEEAVIARVGNIAIDNDNHLYVLDTGSRRLISFDSDGSVRWAGGRAGEGPEEFSQPLGMAYDGNEHLWISNQRGNRLDVWHIDGTFDQSVATDHLERSFLRAEAFVSASKLLSTSSKQGGLGVNIHIDHVGDEIEPATEFYIDESDGRDIPRMVRAYMGISVIDDIIVSSTPDRYRLRFFDLDGEVQRNVTRTDVEGARGLAVVEGEMFTLLGGVSPPLQLSSGHFMALHRWVANLQHPDEAFEAEGSELERRQALDFFDEEGRFLGSIEMEEHELDELGRPMKVGPDGQLYTYAEYPYPQIRRYRVEIE